MNLIAKLNFARVVILVSFLGSAVLGYMLYVQSQHLAEVDRTLRGAPQRIQNLQVSAMQVKELTRQLGDEGLGKQTNPEEYIVQVGYDPSVKISQVEISSRDKNGKGYVDTEFTIRPSKRTNQTFSLGQIANFAYRLEEKSRRVRVTEVEIKPAGRKVKEHEVLPGEWDFTLAMTTREKTE